METVRKPSVSGLFYSDSKEELCDEINTLLEKNKSDFSPEKIFGLVVPHAGYLYSGKTAAYAYNMLKGKNYKTAIILAPSHREYFPGISVYSGDAYETPLGIIPVNKEIAASLTSKTRDIFLGLIGHGEHEHSLEVQLPFLQSVLGDFNLVPVVIGDQSKNFINELSGILSEIVTDDTIIVASSDLSHFHDKNAARELDQVVAGLIEQMDHDELLNSLAENKCEACGGGPIATLLETAKTKKINKAKILHKSDSGDVTGDTTGVVGYLSAVIYE